MPQAISTIYHQISAFSRPSQKSVLTLTLTPTFHFQPCAPSPYPARSGSSDRHAPTQRTLLLANGGLPSYAGSLVFRAEKTAMIRWGEGAAGGCLSQSQAA